MDEPALREGLLTEYPKRERLHDGLLTRPSGGTPGPLISGSSVSSTHSFTRRLHGLSRTLVAYEALKSETTEMLQSFSSPSWRLHGNNGWRDEGPLLRFPELWAPTNQRDCMHQEIERKQIPAAPCEHYFVK